MEIKQSKEVKITAIVALKCNCCLRVVDKDDLEFDDFLSIRLIAGFGSIFGDGNRIVGDFCPVCVKKTLGKFLEVEG